MTATDYRTDPEFLALLETVRISPDDDAPRGIIADWIRDAGDDARADLIQIQLDIAEHQRQQRTIHPHDRNESDRHFRELRRREDEAFGRWWLECGCGEYPGIYHQCSDSIRFPTLVGGEMVFEWSRGFVSGVRLPMADLLGKPCPQCEGRGAVRERGGHGDYDTVLCEGCNPDAFKRMIGERHPLTGFVGGVLGELFKDHPLISVTLTCREPVEVYEGGVGGVVGWHDVNFMSGGSGTDYLPVVLIQRMADLNLGDGTRRYRYFDSVKEANDAISTVLVSIGREVAGLPALA